MIFKARFKNPVNEATIDSINLDINFNSIIGREIIYYNNHEFEIERDENNHTAIQSQN